MDGTSKVCRNFEVAIGSVTYTTIVGIAGGNVHLNSAEFQRGHTSADAPLGEPLVAKSHNLRTDKETFAEDVISI